VVRRSAVLALLGPLVGCSSTPPPADAPDAGSPGTGADDAGTSTEPTGPPAIRYIGRFDTTDANGPRVGCAGARVVVRFEGTSLTAKLDETNRYRGPSRYDVIVDGQLGPTPLVPAVGSSDQPIAKDLSAGTHVVELWRRTEGQVGITQFRVFDFGGGQLLAPPVAKTRHIEYVGDSESNGYGIECANANEAFSGATQNEHKAYTAIVAGNLSAEYSNVSFSGKGVSRNFDDSDTDTMSAIYLRTLPEDPTSTWSFASWVPDLVVIALGANDYSNPTQRSAPDAATFKAKYGELVALVRSKNPNAHILCSVEGGLSDDYPTGWKAFTHVSTAVKAVVDGLGDPRVHYYEFPRADGSGPNGEPDITGCDGHPNAGYNQRAATDVTAKIKSLMGW
jgi:lysophospholipase L1-like esterase